jgi:hypothetical protein
VIKHMKNVHLLEPARIFEDASSRKAIYHVRSCAYVIHVEFLDR